MELQVPHSRRAGLAVVVLAAFVGLFVWLSAANLVRWREIGWGARFGSAAWLALVGLAVAGSAYGLGGARRMLVVWGGNFAKRQFLRIDSSKIHGGSIRSGYRLLGREFDYFRASLDGIKLISWNPGQATHMRGRECKDWTVGVWLATASIQTNPGGWDRRETTQVKIIGIPDAREKAESLGRSVVEMIQSAGVALAPDGALCRYRRVE